MLTLEEHDRTCASCGEVANPMGGTGEVLTAPAPLKPTSKGRFSLEFAAQVALDKYADQLPLAHQAKRMKRQGLLVQPNVLWSQVWHLSNHLRPSCEAIYTAAFDEPVLGADETGWPMLEKGRKLWQVRCLTSPRLSYFRIVARKDTTSALEPLTHPEHGVFTGTLMIDGAAAYEAAQREADNAFGVVNCWSHARRKLIEAEPDFPQASEALDIIAKLYQVEREALAAPEPERRETTQRLRTERSKPLTAELREWMTGATTRWAGSASRNFRRACDQHPWSMKAPLVSRRAASYAAAPSVTRMPVNTPLSGCSSRSRALFVSFFGTIQARAPSVHSAKEL